MKMIIGALLVVGAVSVSGCYKDIRDYCKEEVDCEGGNEDDEKACVEVYKGERNAAKEKDCKDEFDDLMECLASESSCESDYYGGDSYTDNGECDGEGEDYGDCMD